MKKAYDILAENLNHDFLLTLQKPKFRTNFFNLQ